MREGSRLGVQSMQLTSVGAARSVNLLDAGLYSCAISHRRWATGATRRGDPSGVPLEPFRLEPLRSAAFREQFRSAGRHAQRVWQCAACSGWVHRRFLDAGVQAAGVQRAGARQQACRAPSPSARSEADESRGGDSRGRISTTGTSRARACRSTASRGRLAADWVCVRHTASTRASWGPARGDAILHRSEKCIHSAFRRDFARRASDDCDKLPLRFS
jgi:hypothetical protein